MEGRILVADDDDQNRLLLRLFCERWGFKVIEAKDGKETIEIALREKPDLILMDVMMPVLDGFSTLKVLKDMEETKAIPVILITALDTEDLGREGSPKAEDTIPKPVAMEELRRKIRGCLKGHGDRERGSVNQNSDPFPSPSE